MRIGFYTDTFLPAVGGAELMLHRIASRLHDRGWRVRVLAPRADGEPSLPYPVERYRKPFSKRFGVKWILPRLRRMHAVEPLDVLHCHAAYPQAYVAAAFKRETGVPYVVRPHGSDVLPGRRIRRDGTLEPRLREGLAHAATVIAQGAYLKDVVSELGVPDERITVIHNGVDLAQFARHAPFDHPGPYMLGLGNLKTRKGFDVLVRAYAELRDPPMDLLIAGDGEEAQALNDLARDLGVAERIRFIGRIDGQDKVNLYRSAELFVCPSRQEPFANVILEAMACDLPVIASNVGGNVEMVVEGETGLLFETENAASLTAALQQMIDDAPRRDRMREATRQRAQLFDMDRVVDRYAELYQRVS